MGMLLRTLNFVESQLLPNASYCNASFVAFLRTARGTGNYNARNMEGCWDVGQSLVMHKYVRELALSTC